MTGPVQMFVDIRIGKKPVEEPKPKRRRRTCSYCLGDVGPDGHNSRTCKQRLADAETA